MAERAALFFFSRAELLSTRYCVRPGTDCFPLVFLVSEGRTSQSIFLLAPELEIRLRRAREHGVLIYVLPFFLAVVAVRSSHSKQPRPIGPPPYLPHHYDGGEWKSPHTHGRYGITATTDRHRSCRGASFALLRFFSLRGKPVRCRGTVPGENEQQHQHRPCVFRSLQGNRGDCWLGEVRGRTPPAGFVVFPLPPPSDVRPQRRIARTTGKRKTRNESVRTHLSITFFIRYNRGQMSLRVG